MASQHFDVLIIGAGVSGIGTGCFLRQKSRHKSFVILERRQALGGTWDLFRYPGIRSDSDMFTFGYNFRPWMGNSVLADGPSIKEYVRETAAAYGVDKTIRFGRKVVKAAWSSEHCHWTVSAEVDGQLEVYTANFVVSATGYYDYDNPYKPDFPGEENFKGPIIHPQLWPEDLDYTGQKVVVIGSGATAVTVVPAMAETAGHVTMLQRSPSYVVAVPPVDKLSEGLSRFLPRSVVYALGRVRNVALQRTMWVLSKTQPQLVRRLILRWAKAQLGPDFDMKHFTPTYNPWDERMCAVPSGDLFKAIRRGRVSVETDNINRFTESGILLESGKHLDADIIVSATGLNLQVMSGLDFEVDGQVMRANTQMLYKSILIEDFPNMAMIFGYTNASWTLKADIANEYICRLINYMDKKGYHKVVPHDTMNSKSDFSFADGEDGGLKSGYIKRKANELPRNGLKGPWKTLMNYFEDAPMLRFGPIDDKELQFSHRPVAQAAPSKTRPTPQGVGRV